MMKLKKIVNSTMVYDSRKHDDANGKYVIKIEDESITSNKFNSVKLFVEFVIKKLHIVGLIKIILTTDRKKYNIKTFAYYDNNKSLCVVYSKNRKIADVLRSIAHEMIHKHQYENNKIQEPVQDIGGKIEDEANALAGRYVKEFGYKNSEIFENKIV